MGGQVLEAACMLTGKSAKVEELYDEKTLEVASKRFRGGIGLQELLLEAGWANGYTGRNFRDSRAVPTRYLSQLGLVSLIQKRLELVRSH